MPEFSDDTPSAIILCPHCGNKTRVPESHFGTLVQCPECSKVYKAPIRDKEGNIGPATIPVIAPPVPAVTFKTSTLLVPGLMMFLVGLTGFLFEAVTYYNFSIKREETLSKFKVVFQDPNNDFRKFTEKLCDAKIEADDVTEKNLNSVANHATYFLPVNLVIIATSFCILFRGFYKFAIFGSGVCFVNFGFACCFLSGPVGLFALVKLFDPDSKKLFR